MPYIDQGLFPSYPRCLLSATEPDKEEPFTCDSEGLIDEREWFFSLMMEALDFTSENSPPELTELDLSVSNHAR